MDARIGKVLLTADRIAARVRQLGRRLARAYAGREPVLVAVMKGCFLLAADLVRAWPGPLDVEFVSAESYAGTRPGAVRLRVPRGLRSRIAGRPVLVVDDIYDTGATLAKVCRALEALRPAEVRTLVLFRKRRAPARTGPAGAARSGHRRPRRRTRPAAVRPDWVGFDIPDRFVVGYGLDYCGRYRNLPYLAVLRQGR
ncbi:MAG: phosphoribosyltransferase family protein [Planctomycetota bacterium]|nr:phosphoribosyltransferase family protein [Planctomycetota bacterium]